MKNFLAMTGFSVPAMVLLLFFAVPPARQMTDYTGQVFPSDHALNMPIDALPVHPNSDNYIASIGGSTSLHPDFGTSWNDDGTDRQIGIPYNIVGAAQPLVPITFVLYNDESDPGPWPVPKDPFIETVFDWRENGEGDRHMLIVDSNACILYETGNTTGNADGTAWEGGCGAVFDLNGYSLRPEKWTSADAAGLPIFPLLIRYDEVERARSAGGEIHHAIRFTVQRSQRAYVWPARHYASSSTDENLAPMGLRFRLKADVDITTYSPRMQAILRTMKKYGMIVADNGSNWYFQGTHDERWDDDEINTLKKLHGNNFEAVDITPWTNRSGFDPSSGKVPGASGVTNNIAFHFKSGDNLAVTRNPGTATSFTVSYYLAKPGMATIKVYDASGRIITTLLHGVKPMGHHSLVWNVKDTTGNKNGSGTFVLQLKHADGHSAVSTIIGIF
jgi:hypothetical protein